MTESGKQPFDWQELSAIFCIREGECGDKSRESVLKRVNDLTDKYGREYVINKIALGKKQ